MTEIEISQALRIVDRVLEPNRLNAVEELVFTECWLGTTYQEISASSGYDSDYIRVVGSRLWQNLSNAFEEKVTKNNFKAVLRQRARNQQFSCKTIEFPDGQVPLNSSFYIIRPPDETLAYAEILNPGALIRIKSPFYTGKTSLMIRILAHGRSHNYNTVNINFQLAEASVFSSFKKFMRWLMANITLQLGITSKLNEYWDEDIGIKVSCTAYLQKYILGRLSNPLIIAFDEVNHLLEYPEIAREFLPVLRFWHEEANNYPIWQNLRLIVVHSTDVYIPLDINQSPFNLGLPITLPQFTFEQMKNLAKRHPFQSKVENLDKFIVDLMNMIGGHAHLARLAFYALSTKNITLEQLLAEAPTASGIYRNHLQRHLVVFQKNPDLARSYYQVVCADKPIQISAMASYKLESIGLAKLVNNKVKPSCQLYRLYFRDCLEKEIDLIN